MKLFQGGMDKRYFSSFISIFLVCIWIVAIAAQNSPFEKAPSAEAWVDPCADCSPDADCVQTLSGYACECKRGYRGDGKTCVDIDECAEGIAGCHEKAICINTPGSYICECIEGYEGDGWICNAMKQGKFAVELPPKEESAQQEGLFLELRGGTEISISQLEAKSFRDPGWTAWKQGQLVEAEVSYELPKALTSGEVGSYEIWYEAKDADGTAAEKKRRIVHVTDIDECALGLHKCSVHAECINTVGSYQCKCKEGFEGDGFKCSDIDECKRGLHHCSPHATCYNTIGSYQCRCNPGFEGDGFICNDIDECALGTHQCDPNAHCINTIGSYECECNAGFKGDGFTCTPIDSCEEGTHDCHEYADCYKHPTDPKGYKCVCKPGFQGDGHYCEDINECEIPSLHYCPIHSHCVNTIGSYTCECDEGFEPHPTEPKLCIDIDECAREIHDCDPNAVCTNTVGGYICTCNEGFVGDGRKCTPIGGAADITLRGANPLIMNQCESYIEEGFTLDDAKRETLKVSVSIPPPLLQEPVMQVGEHTVKYNLLDGEGRRYVRTRTVIVNPINPCELPAGHVCAPKCAPYTKCVPDPTSAKGYQCECGEGFMREITPEGGITCKDIVPPVIELLGDNPVVLRACKVCKWYDPGEWYNEERHGGYHAYDQWPDGKRLDLTAKVQIYNETLNETAWLITYSVEDPAGNKAENQTRLVVKEVQDVHRDIYNMKRVLEERFGELEPKTRQLEMIFGPLQVLLQIMGVVVLVLVGWYLLPRVICMLRVMVSSDVTYDDYMIAYDLWYSLIHPFWTTIQRQRVIHQQWQLRHRDK